jgi:hypothetical protein
MKAIESHVFSVIIEKLEELVKSTVLSHQKSYYLKKNTLVIQSMKQRARHRIAPTKQSRVVMGSAVLICLNGKGVIQESCCFFSRALPFMFELGKNNFLNYFFEPRNIFFSGRPNGKKFKFEFFNFSWGGGGHSPYL